MASVLKNNGVQQPVSELQKREKQYASARSNLLLVLILSAVNMVLLITGANSYFLFSAAIPYFFVAIGMFLCGKYPAEYYGEEFANAEFFGDGVFYGLLAVAAVFLVLYFLSWLFSKNNKVGWLIFALIFFVIDTAAMFFLFEIGPDTIIDMIAHVWVIGSLSLGIFAHYQRKKLPPQEPVSALETECVSADSEPTVAFAPSYAPPAFVPTPADPNVKAKVFLAFDALGHKVVYRRVKRVNELVIDGYVYDTYEALMEAPHELKTTLDGHVIAVGYNGVQSYGSVDGVNVTSKIRWI